MRYEIYLYHDDIAALDAVNELFTNVVIAPARETCAIVVTFDAGPYALLAYATRFGLLDEFYDADAPLFDRA